MYRNSRAEMSKAIVKNDFSIIEKYSSKTRLSVKKISGKFHQQNENCSRKEEFLIFNNSEICHGAFGEILLCQIEGNSTLFACK